MQTTEADKPNDEMKREFCAERLQLQEFWGEMRIMACSFRRILESVCTRKAGEEVLVGDSINIYELNLWKVSSRKP